MGEEAIHKVRRHPRLQTLPQLLFSFFSILPQTVQQAYPVRVDSATGYSASEGESRLREREHLWYTVWHTGGL